MRIQLSVVIAALALLIAAPAAEAATYENAARLVAAMGLRAEIDRAIGEAVSTVRTQLVQQGAPAQKVDEFVAAFRDELEAGAPELVEEMARAYADRFSDAEIDDLIVFYKSPTGQKLVGAQHDLALAQTQAVVRWVTAAAQSATAKLNAVNNGASV